MFAKFYSCHVLNKKMICSEPIQLSYLLFVLYTLLAEPTKENGFSEIFIIVFLCLLNTVAGITGTQMISVEWITNEPMKTVNN